MLRRLAHHQPETFAFTPANQAWAEAQISKYPEGRQASAVIPLLWRAQEQEGWLSRPAIEHVADMLGMAYIRALEVATFYFMFQLHPVGSVAHVQICGTLSCMICGAEDLVGLCKTKISPEAHQPSADGKFSWEEVECLGACSNAPMAQIGKDYYEDLTVARLGEILDEMAAGRVPTPGPQNGRFASEPKSGLTSLPVGEGKREKQNASVALALAIGDTVKRIDGTEVPLVAPWRDGKAAGGKPAGGKVAARKAAPSETAGKPEAAASGAAEKATKETVAKDVSGKADGAKAKAKPAAEPTGDAAATAKPEDRPAGLAAAREGGADDLKKIKGVGPKLEALLHSMGYYHFDQVANWTAREVAWVDENLEGFKGRVTRDDWVAQAKVLAGGGETEFSKRQK